MPRVLKPKIVYSWRWQADADAPSGHSHRVDWELVGGNGETVCQSNQGFRDKADAHRAANNAAVLLGGNLDSKIFYGDMREVGPGKKPEVR